MSYILLAIPFFFLLIGIELAVDKWRNTGYYRLNDAINSLSAGVLSRVTGVMRRLLPFTLYVILFEHAAMLELPDTPWVWVMAFVLYDFCYYWNHRLGHEVNVLWASHVVHHSSEEYNLTTALRQTSGSFLGWIFYVPLALLGVEPALLATVGSLNLIYQFWVHTRHVPKLGWYEWLFVTPSNHRVHHAQNQVYIDKNYGGVFIIWDRMFGTFQEELDKEPVIFGIRKALHSWNPVWANLHVYTQLAKDCWRTQSWKDKFLVWFKRTGWRPADVEEKYPLPRADLSKFKKFDIPLSATAKVYALIQYVLTTAVALLLLLNLSALSVTQQMLLVGAVIISNVGIGAVMERQNLGLWLEAIKNIAVLVALLILPLEQWLQVLLAVGSTISLIMLFVVARETPEQELEQVSA